jgi:hypothetical protein
MLKEASGGSFGQNQTARFRGRPSYRFILTLAHIYRRKNLTADIDSQSLQPARDKILFDRTAGPRVTNLHLDRHCVPIFRAISFVFPSAIIAIKMSR